MTGTIQKHWHHWSLTKSSNPCCQGNNDLEIPTVDRGTFPRMQRSSALLQSVSIAQLFQCDNALALEGRGAPPSTLQWLEVRTSVRKPKGTPPSSLNWVNGIQWNYWLSQEGMDSQPTCPQHLETLSPWRVSETDCATTKCWVVMYYLQQKFIFNFCFSLIWKF